MISCIALSQNTFAAWHLDNDRSQLSFVTIKAANIAEVHKFEQISGRLADNGKATINVALTSVNTLIPIRDERMQEYLFEAKIFPQATFTAQLDQSALRNFEVGDISQQSVTGELTIKDRKISVNIIVAAFFTDADTLVVTSVQPFIISAAAVGLEAGVEKLRELAGLPSISQAVPVSFVLTYQRDEK